jgi:hypothetical protein
MEKVERPSTGVVERTLRYDHLKTSNSPEVTKKVTGRQRRE